MAEEQTALETGQEPPETPEPEEEAKPEEGSLEELRAEATKHRRKARAAEQVADELRAEVERLRQSQESEQEKAIREAVEAERERLTAEFGTERLHNRLRLRAAGKLNDPEDAVMHLGTELEPGATDEAIDEALANLIEQKAYLATSGNGPAEGGRGLVSQGARSPAPRSGSGRGEKDPDDWIRSQRR